MMQQVLKAKIQRFFEPQLPAVACEISRQAVSLVRVDPKRSTVIDRFAVIPLPQGLIVPSLTKSNIASVPDFVTAMKSAIAKAEVKSMKMSLAIPDASAKSAIHIMDTLPSSENDRQQLLKWKLKKAVPFNVEEAHLSYWEKKASNGKHVVLTVCISREVLNQYEEVFQRMGIQLGYITLSSFAAFEFLARLDPEVVQKSVLLLRIGATDTSSLIMQEGRVSFFRHSEKNGDEETSFASTPPPPTHFQYQEIYDELYPCVIYYQDKLSSQPLAKIYVACQKEVPLAVFTSLSETFQSPVESLDLMKYFHSPQHAELRSVRHHVLSPLGLAVGRN
jgi:type IV pilus assembly protein PilM